MEALKILSEHIVDPVNRNNLFSCFPQNFHYQIGTFINSMKGCSHTYGPMKSQKTIFLIDTSGSMETGFHIKHESFSRLMFVVHDLHKILHHRVRKGFFFNIITFSDRAYKWKPTLVEATSHNLKQAEHFLDELEAGGGTNTHDALKIAMEELYVEDIYLLSDGEPTHGITNTRDIIADIQSWNLRRKNPVRINTIAFLMGHYTNDPKPRQLMASIAATTGGVYRCLDPNVSEFEEHLVHGHHVEGVFDNDDEFTTYFEMQLSRIPQDIVNSVRNGFSSLSYQQNISLSNPPVLSTPIPSPSISNPSIFPSPMVSPSISNSSIPSSILSSSIPSSSISSLRIPPSLSSPSIPSISNNSISSSSIPPLSVPSSLSSPSIPPSISSSMESPILNQNIIDYRAILKRRTRNAQDLSIPNTKESSNHTLYIIDININGVIPKKNYSLDNFTYFS
jgi:Mg-chelatase subunit ChlD